ncbi:dihydroneopterin monophosphate aldolase [Candidatus Methanoplasma termitum]|uniref:Dihydroneopterin monophosphate aldolase n=1 Tax=Candidatus Methanoplasma termitum TaxID=1577791 RepID=A0A0A7LAP1_9ARCH|nr:6-pyruvoyl tetrahydropterin synthase family protein [Candidatus Methanoplasma termitum]AIZ56078.1 dihydroneopterin monophosphate aldolase [Candidatus Methanoplasma termitum]MCL2333792.1 6-pyruvoyl tetrahydropterin synthase family protein [Candidatus Methanoplasma sp.]
MIIEIDGGHTGISFSSCHFIPMHDKCSRLHGHSYIVRIRLEGEQNESGMVMDFVILKKKLRSMISEMDHKVLLPARSRIVKIVEKNGSVEVTSCNKRYVFPAEDVLMLDVTTTTAEEMARMMTEMIIKDIDFPKTVKSVAIGLDEERGQTAWYTKVL